MSRTVENLFFCLRHPLKAAATKLGQIEVGLEYVPPPHTTTPEEFPNMSVQQAAGLIEEAKRPKVKSVRLSQSPTILGGIPESAWPKSAAQDLANGTLKAPDGRHPIHDY